jgi:diguanylate cyclase (GGDEF)-like protein
MIQRGPGKGLNRALRLAALIVLPFGVLWSLIGFATGIDSLAAQGFIAAVLSVWLLVEERAGRDRPEARLATRIAAGAQLAAISTVLAEPDLGVAIALSSLVPILLALPYVNRRTLSILMVASAAVGAFALIANVVLPWGTPGIAPVALFVPTLALVLVYALFLLFLWNASTRMTDTTSELRHVIEMSHDLAATLDPLDVGHGLARHMAQVAHADDCVLSTWDRDGDRVVTFGSYPVERGYDLEPAYGLAEFPATRRVLETQQPYFTRADDPDADPAEAAYLREVGQKTLVMLPFVVRGESIGIVELSSKRADAFSERDVELAQLLAREAALTFDNARLYDELRLFAYRDSLTGLANRSRLQDRVDHALERLAGRSPNHVALLFIDLDNFKQLIDRFGHAAGDRALQILAERIRTIIRPGDTAGRLGGDEFAVLLEEVESAEVVTAVCQRLLDGLGQPVELDAASPIVGASIGFALSGPDSATSEDLLRNADIAMYAAKSAGRGQVVAFRRDLLETASARSELAAMLRGAEARRELQVHFQPVVELENGAPIGVEALVRWQPRGHVLHLPAEFIGLAEETGEILPIGRWVISESCRHVRELQLKYDLPRLRLYVNLSARQFRDPNLVSMIQAALADAGMEPANLTLEITEGTLLTPGYETVQRIGELRALGLRLAIDDFGTGYSSLGFLNAFQLDELKIDRSFVPGSDGVGDAHVLSQAIVDMGNALGLDIVAEGIETESQADWFRTLGCRLGQGYLFARPMAVADLDRYLRRYVRPARRGRRSDGLPKPTIQTPDASSRFVVAGITDVVGARKAG